MGRWLKPTVLLEPASLATMGAPLGLTFALFLTLTPAAGKPIASVSRRRFLALCVSVTAQDRDQTGLKSNLHISVIDAA